MQHIVALVTIKGGAGKSTVCLSVATEWKARGRKVVVVDLDDVQRTAFDWSNAAEDQGRDACDVIAMGDAIKTRLASVTAAHEIVLLDTPGRITVSAASGQRVEDRATWALGLADLAIMPCPPPAQSVWAMAPTFLQVREVRARRPELDAAVLITKKKQGTVLARTARDSFVDAPFPVLGTELNESTTYDYAYAAGMGPTTYDPTSAAAEQVRALVDELEVRLGMRKGRRGKAVLRAIS